MNDNIKEAPPTLRDVFAGFALMGILADASTPINMEAKDDIARAAWELADQMLATRGDGE